MRLGRRANPGQFFCFPARRPPPLPHRPRRRGLHNRATHDSHHGPGRDPRHRGPTSAARSNFAKGTTKSKTFPEFLNVLITLIADIRRLAPRSLEQSSRAFHGWSGEVSEDIQLLSIRTNADLGRNAEGVHVARRCHDLALPGRQLQALTVPETPFNERTHNDETYLSARLPGVRSHWMCSIRCCGRRAVARMTASSWGSRMQS